VFVSKVIIKKPLCFLKLVIKKLTALPEKLVKRSKEFKTNYYEQIIF